MDLFLVLYYFILFGVNNCVCTSYGEVDLHSRKQINGTLKYLFEIDVIILINNTGSLARVGGKSSRNRLLGNYPPT